MPYLDIKNTSTQQLHEEMQYYYHILQSYLDSPGHQRDVEYITELLLKIDVEIWKREHGLN